MRQKATPYRKPPRNTPNNQDRTKFFIDRSYKVLRIRTNSDGVGQVNLSTHVTLKAHRIDASMGFRAIPSCAALQTS